MHVISDDFDSEALKNKKHWYVCMMRFTCLPSMSSPIGIPLIRLSSSTLMIWSAC